MGFEVINKLKKEKGLTNAQIAEASGVTLSTLDKITSGVNTNPKLDTLQAICRVLDCTINDFVDLPFGTKKSPSLSDEALKVARDYNSLDDRGKGAVMAILNYEGGAISLEPPAEESTKTAIVSFPKAKKNSNGIIEIKTYDQPAAAGLGNYLDEPDYHIEQYPVDVIPSKADFGIVISGDSMEPKIHDGGTVFVQAAPSIDTGKIGIFVLNKQAYCKQLMVDRTSRQIRLVSLNKNYDDILIKEFDELYTVGLVLGQWTKGYAQDIFGR